jgi:TonB family protein
MDETTQLAEQMPSTIGRYKVQECVGYGAMGAVYKAFDPLIKRTLAIKTIRLDIPRNAPQYKSFIERFQHEARISGTLSHPNIVTLFDIGEEGGLPFLAMEFVAGETIAALIEKGVRFDPERVVSLVSQVASAVDYAHAKGVVHRDIKPSNLILAEGDNVKVTDFGIAKLADAEMTQSGVLLGTPSYMSPEQAMGEKLDGRSDIFSLGVCAFEMLSGEQPFPGNNVTSILYKLVHVDPIEPANLEMSGLIPEKWREVFGKVLAKKPDDRYQTAAEFVHDLEYCLGSWFGAAMGDETILTPAPVPAAVASAASAVSAGAAPAAAASEQPDVTSELPTVFAPAASRVNPPAPVAMEQTRPIAVTATPVPAGDDATVVMPPTKRVSSRSGDPTATAKYTADASRPEPNEEQAATVLMSAAVLPEATAIDDGATVLMPGIAVAAASADVTAGGGGLSTSRPRGVTATPSPAGSIRASVSPDRSTPRPGPAPSRATRAVPRALLIGAGALSFVAVVVAVTAFALWRRGLHPAAPTTAPSPVQTAAIPTPAAVIDGFLRITTRPTGAEITINGEPRGSAPYEGRLPLGLYDVQIALTGYETQARTVDLTAAKPKFDLDLALERSAPQATTGLADITSTPTGAAVSVDGAAVGTTPLRGVELAPGERHLELGKPGYAAVSRIVKVVAGRRVAVDLTLSAIVVVHATPRPTPTPVAVDAGRVYGEREVDTPPQKLRGDSPDASSLPHMKRGERISVAVTFVVDETGEVSDLAISESQGGERLNQAVISALRRWRFTPGVKGGVKVKVRESRKFTYEAG